MASDDGEETCERGECTRPAAHVCDGCFDRLCHWHMHEYGDCPAHQPFVFDRCSACQLEMDE